MAIGGYFELELPHGEECHKNAIRLNTGRNAFEYVLRAKAYQKVYLPYYTCDVMLEPIQKLNLRYEFYSIDEFLQPIFDFSIIKDDEVFVYNNYFGICDEQVNKVAAECKNLIIDNSQAFYSLPLPGVDTFYSPRKFFGLPDGSYLYTNKLLNAELEQDFSYKRCEHLLGRMDTGAEAHFHTYKENSKSLCNQPIKQMSKLTQRLLKSIDYKTIAKTRKQNFNYLHNNLKSVNQLNFKIDNNAVPMVYPFLIDHGAILKKELLANKIFVATYWPNVLEWCKRKSVEFNLYENLLVLPIDQRYRIIEMKIIINILGGYTNEEF